MKRIAVLYNPLSSAGEGHANARKLEDIFPEAEFIYQDLMKIRVDEYAKTLPEGTDIVFSGGDGTINQVINQIYGKDLGKRIFYFAAGTGNDFMNDIEKKPEAGPVLMDDYTKHLPVVSVNGQDYAFVNGIGLGLDGFCCDENNRLKAEGKKKPYTLIAVEGLLGRYKPANAVVTIDGVTKEYKNVWMATVMYGRYFGGGVIIAPDQSRDDPEQQVTSIIVHDVSGVKAASIFLKVTSGEGPKYPKYIQYTKGHDIHVKFDRKTSLQIDGETVREVDEYRVIC